MEQFARRPLTRRHHFPQHTAFLLREGNAKFGHGKSPSPQTTLRSEKENRPGSTCQSKIAKLLVSPSVAVASFNAETNCKNRRICLTLQKAQEAGVWLC